MSRPDDLLATSADILEQINVLLGDTKDLLYRSGVSEISTPAQATILRRLDRLADLIGLLRDRENQSEDV